LHLSALFAVWALISGLDDLALDLAFFWRWIWFRLNPPRRRPVRAASRRIAIFVPLWREDGVIRSMVERNVRALREYDCEFFVGVYPNDEETLLAARELERRLARVHVSICPHAGPTSKADNLNWIFERMQETEQERGRRFDVVITHDAEDVIHPDALRLVARHIEQYDMVQIPVLPIATPPLELMHGVYCDEFADYQSRELPAREFLGGFLPSCGVGAALSRRAVDQLAEAHNGRPFDPQCLTEDYECGFRLRQLGCAQTLVPIARRGGDIVATRAYFPRQFRAAVRQRTRWVMGIALQSWEMHGWRETAGQLYWFWRDRKGLVGAVAGPVANAVFLYGLLGWEPGSPLSRYFLDPSTWWIADVFAFSMSLQTLHLGLRIRSSARVYGWRFAALTPLRLPLAGAVTFAAALCAIQRYAASRWSGQPLAWLKTEHHFPEPAEAVAPAKSRAAGAGD
jgi:adsorption protein B